MLTFEQQQKILTPLLARPTNKNCADCGAATPTWASLDFGVFVCSNCSGAHRALSATVTRIKSTKLDLWQRDWVQNMRIGNNQINMYWQQKVEDANIKKPKLGATLDDHNRYVVDKYIRKKFMNDKTKIDPLKAYKQGSYTAPNITPQQTRSAVSMPQQQNQKSIIPETREQQKNIVKNQPPVAKSATFSLLDDDQQPTLNNHNNRPPVYNAANGDKFSNQEEPDDEFDDFVEASPQINHQQNSINSQTKSQGLSFDDLMKAPQLTSHNSSPGQHQMNNNFNHHNYGSYNQHQHMSMNNGHNQNGYSHNSYANNVQQNYTNYHHNPYIGYVPHHTGNGNHQMNGINGMNGGYHQYQQYNQYHHQQPQPQQYQGNNQNNYLNFTLN